MEWREIIADLRRSGVTQARIAAECGIGQSTVSELGSGTILSPRFDVGAKLLALHAAHVSAPSEPATEPATASEAS